MKGNAQKPKQFVFVLPFVVLDETRVVVRLYLHRGNPEPEKILSLNIPSKRAAKAQTGKKIWSAILSTGPYSPDQDGPSDKTSQGGGKRKVEASSLVVLVVPRCRSRLTCVGVCKLLIFFLNF